MTTKDWKVVSLSDVACLVMGQSPDSRYYTDEEVGLPFLQGCAEFQSKFPQPFLHCSHPKKIVEPGSILFSVRAPVGKINIADRRYAIGRGIAGISAVKIDSQYLEHYLKHCEGKFGIASQGSTFEAINSQELGSWPIKFPRSLLEQNKIAHILSTVDRAIEQTEALIAKQQRIKAGLMQDLLTRGIDEQGNLRSEKTHQFKDSLLGRIPAEWDVCPISTFGPRSHPWLRTGPFGSDLNTKHWVKNGIPVLTIGSLGESGLVEAELLYISESTAGGLSAFIVSPGDLVFSRVADIGRCLVIQKQQRGWIISSNLMRISIDLSRANPDFLHMNIVHNTGLGKQLRSITNSNGRELVNGSILSSLVFPWPDLHEQRRVVDSCKLVAQEQSSLQSQCAKLRSLKTALMQDLLTGRKRVTALLPKAEMANV